MTPTTEESKNKTASEQYFTGSGDLEANKTEDGNEDGNEEEDSNAKCGVLIEGDEEEIVFEEEIKEGNNEESPGSVFEIVTGQGNEGDDDEGRDESHTKTETGQGNEDEEKNEEKQEKKQEKNGKNEGKKRESTGNGNDNDKGNDNSKRNANGNDNSKRKGKTRSDDKGDGDENHNDDHVNNDHNDEGGSNHYENDNNILNDQGVKTALKRVKKEILEEVMVKIENLQAEVTEIKNLQETTETSETTGMMVCDNKKLPPDSYSFLVPISPNHKIKFTIFGWIVFLIQIAFLILLSWSVLDRKHGTTEEKDNPYYSQSESIFSESIFPVFIPANYKLLMKITQALSLFIYVYISESTLDVLTAALYFPAFTFNKFRNDHLVQSMMLSCALKAIQGFFAVIATFILVMMSNSVVEVILNFPAMAFISELDEKAFELAETGLFGEAFTKQAEDIKNKDVPGIFRRKHVRFIHTIILSLTGFGLFAVVAYIYVRQYQSEQWLTQEFRLEFNKDSQYATYSGCFDIDDKSRKFDRFIYRSISHNSPTSIGYCLNDTRWTLFDRNETNPCTKNLILHSRPTEDFDVAKSFEDLWFDSGDSIVEVNFYHELDGELHCDSFRGDGFCDEDFNSLAENFDDGDCCASTCTKPNCGGGKKSVFGKSTSTAIHFDKCSDPQMEKITIQFNGMSSSRDKLYLPELPSQINLLEEDEFRNEVPSATYFALDCDGKNVLTTFVDDTMINTSEIVMVEDGADCTLTTKTTKGRPLAPPSWYVNYTLYHNETIEILTENSFDIGVKNFTRIPECFFRKLGKYVDGSSMYADTNKAIKSLLDNRNGNSKCEDDSFVEIYALTKINFEMEASIINKENLCTWPSITCSRGNVTQLDLAESNINTTKIPSEIVLLKDLEVLILDYNKFNISLLHLVRDLKNMTKLKNLSAKSNSIGGPIPTEITELTSLSSLKLTANGLTGAIPTELGEMTSLNTLDLSSNDLTGTIPTEFGEMTSLNTLDLYDNGLTGTIPTELGEMTSLNTLYLPSNDLTGTIPTELGEMTSLNTLALFFNDLTGTIPTEFNEMTSLNRLDLSFNGLTGTIPTELGEMTSLNRLDLSFNDLTGTIPTELGEMTSLNTLDLCPNDLTGIIPTELGELNIFHTDIDADFHNGTDSGLDLLVC